MRLIGVSAPIEPLQCSMACLITSRG